MPWITRPQVYRMVREMLPRRTLGPEELLRWLEDVQLRNERAQPPPTRSAEPTNNTQPSHPHNPVVVMLEESKKMNDDQLERSLRSIGKWCFVTYFCQFADQTLADRQVIELLIRQEGYTESGSRTRVSQARRIIGSGRAGDALRNVIQSGRIPNYERIATKARELLSKTGG